MIRRLVTGGFFLFSCGIAFSQQVQNVKAVQAGNDVLVTYDLMDNTNKSYFVKLYVSKDGGVSFTDELRSVTGDVKQNAMPGANKKIIWSGKQEMGPFSGDAVFKVEALSKAATASVEGVQNRCLRVELNEVKSESSRLKVDFTITPITSNCTIYLSAYVTNTYLVDNYKNKIKITDGFVAGTPKGQDKAALNNVPLRGYVTFDGVDPSMSAIPNLTLYVGSLGACVADNATAAFTFTNVSVSK
ncbi:MAG: hypothetical protein K2U26_05870 [Cyclobacteriaceae bacterium]|nr:hypothetical protein [Cyclobacteriaceae bacterium]